MSETAQTSGLKAAGTTVIYTGSCIFLGMKVLGDGTNGATAIVYDALTAVAPIVAKGICDATQGEANGQSDLSCGVFCKTGLTLVLSGTNSGAIVYFRAM